jgi:DNA invertase Pin-like site-specific DNA recombinase
MLQMNGDLLSLIDYTVKKTASETAAELRRQNLIIEGKQTPFQKTETLLFNYNNFLAAIKDKEDQIREIRENGLRKKSSSITSFSGGSGLIEVKSDAEKTEEKIETIEFSIATTRTFVKIVDDAIDMLKDDPYYDLISMRYFEGRTREQIAEHFDCDVSTVNRNKNRLINLLQIRLFSDEVIRQIFMS